MKWLWRWSLVATLPVAALFLYWGWATAHRYTDFGLRIRSAEPFSLRKVGSMELDHILRRLQLAVFSPMSSTSALEDPYLKTVSLFVPEGELARLNARLPHSGFEYVDAGMWYEGKTRKVKVRYRGDNVYHWGYWKKSFRVKTRREAMYDDMRSFNLVAPRFPELLNNYLSYQLADTLDLIGPHTELVNVTLNGRLLGLYTLTEQLEELTVRHHGYMPGDLYSGELIALDAYSGLDSGLPSLFDHPGLWTKVAVNNHFAEDSMAPLEQLIRVLQLPDSEEKHRRLGRLVDLDAFARFSALEMLVGTNHVDSIHNWRLYYDPWRTRFYPVVWDLMGFLNQVTAISLRKPRTDVISSPLHEALYRNGDFLRARARVVREFFTSGKDRVFLSEIDRTIAGLETSVRADANLVARVVVLSPDEVMAAMRRLRAMTERLWTKLRHLELGGVGEVVYAQRDHGAVALSVSGRRPVEQLVFRFRRPLEARASMALRFWRGGKRIERDLSGALRHGGSTLELQAALLPHFVPLIATMVPGRVIDNHVRVDPGYYELVLKGVDRGNPLVEVLVGRGDGRLESARRAASVTRGSFDGTWAVVHDHPLQETLVLEGELLITEDFESDAPVLVRPGTLFKMGPGATLVLRNRLLAEGTEEAPIRFVPASPGQEPWGAVVLAGTDADGSRLRHCEFVAGSGEKGELFEYSAMLSIHDVPRVELDHCRFRDSRIVDDMVHVVYSDIDFRNCVFEGSLFDALDLDICTASIRDCVFRNSGNDSMDLMTSRVLVLDTRVEASGDKAISVGEDSRLLAANSRFVGCAIGVQSKDDSLAALYNVDILDGGQALDAYKKNWRYNGGGNMVVDKCRIAGNAKMVTADKYSSIRIHDSYLDRPVDPDQDRVAVDASVDNKNPATARRPGLVVPEEILRVFDVDPKSLSGVNPSRRGSAWTN